MMQNTLFPIALPALFRRLIGVLISKILDTYTSSIIILIYLHTPCDSVILAPLYLYLTTHPFSLCAEGQCAVLFLRRPRCSSF